MSKAYTIIKKEIKKNKKSFPHTVVLQEFLDEELTVKAKSLSPDETWIVLYVEEYALWMFKSKVVLEVFTEFAKTKGHAIVHVI